MIKQQYPTVISNKFQLEKEFLEIQSRIKNNFNSDFILAVFDHKDKEFAQEMIHNSSFIVRMFERMIDSFQVDIWNNEDKTWHTTKVDDETRRQIRTIYQRTFDAYVTRLYGMATLNRNKSNNYIINTLAGSEEETRQIREQEHNLSVIDKLKEAMKRDNQSKIQS